MIQNLIWATGYNVVALPLAAAALYAWCILLTPAVGAVLMAGSTVVVAINARMLRLRGHRTASSNDHSPDIGKPKSETQTQNQEN